MFTIILLEGHQDSTCQRLMTRLQKSWYEVLFILSDVKSCFEPHRHRFALYSVQWPQFPFFQNPNFMIAGDRKYHQHGKMQLVHGCLRCRHWCCSETDYVWQGTLHLSRYVNKQNCWNGSDEQVFGKYLVYKSWFGVQCQLLEFLGCNSVMKAIVQ